MENSLRSEFVPGTAAEMSARDRLNARRENIRKKRYIRIRIGSFRTGKILVPSFIYDRKKRKRLALALVILISAALIYTYAVPAVSNVVDIDKVAEFISTIGKEKSEGGFVIETVDGVTTIDGIKITNKTYELPKDYGDGLTPETQAAFDRMSKAAAADGIELIILSGFRSYDTQKDLYESYVKKDGLEKAEAYSARPGHSEHQLGEAVDLNWLDPTFGETEAGKWLGKHAYEYGFILRYPPDKQDVTGFMSEPWHFRYVGKDFAAKLYNNGTWTTIEEYFGITSEYAPETEE